MATLINQCPRRHEESHGSSSTGLSALPSHFSGQKVIGEKSSDTPKQNLPTQFSRVFQGGRASTSASAKMSVEVCS